MRLALAALFCVNTFGATLLDTAPLRFEPNPQLETQWGATSAAKWSARGPGYAYLFADRATLLRTSGGTAELTFPGANTAARFAGEKPLNTKINYFVGHESASVQAYARLRRAALWPGVDLVYYGVGHQIEYDFEIAPGADASRIRMRFRGAGRVRLNDRGDIVIDGGAGEIVQRKPMVYQRLDSGEIAAIASSYVLDRHGTAHVKLGRYDRRRTLTVDPVITYDAYLSGEQPDMVVSVGHDPTGKIYLAGSTFSTEFPTTAQAYQFTSPVGPEHLWVAQIDPTAGASALVYCSYIGGQSNDIASQMVVDVNGVMYITGSSDSTNYPTTSGGYQPTYSGNNTHGFVTMIDPSQGVNGLIYSTYFGGTTDSAGNESNDQGNGIAVANGKIYVTGWTTSIDLPVTANAYQGTLNAGNDAWIAEFDPTQSGTASLLNSTFLGGSLDDEGDSIAVDSAGLVYIGGMTGSFDFPTTPNANQPGFGGVADGFLAVLDMNVGTLNYSSYLGGSDVESVKRIALTASPGNVALVGYTVSSDFPVTFNAYENALQGPGNAFISVLNTSPSVTPGQGLLYSTYFGGSGGEVAYDLHIDSAGRFYIGGYTLSPNFPVTSNAMYSASVGGSIDGFVTVLDPSQPPQTALVYSSYVTGPGMQVIYGVDVDPSGTIYVAGSTTGDVFPNATPPNPLLLKTSVFVLTFTLP